MDNRILSQNNTTGKDQNEAPSQKKRPAGRPFLHGFSPLLGVCPRRIILQIDAKRIRHYSAL